MVRMLYFYGYALLSYEAVNICPSSFAACLWLSTTFLALVNHSCLLDIASSLRRAAPSCSCAPLPILPYLCHSICWGPCPVCSRRWSTPRQTGAGGT
ncbi:uncharacterized protein SCHCODRAFT_02645048 [Schizophyllum commune H4-8]|uniref:uncharacterized protein n=1 Tax=Schizophyllum commune (strain H4-8 / FGSC 9210) TaxID=578458 RepID=UPI00215F74C6|nr:uncharacterized protein SCHCODRAFT_02645048 [Schizophyllum commune H4-8]KAI5885086.1 hypothetical protein SCHCODRAFT_02645048 [Schizophyllum commune H4-8]